MNSMEGLQLVVFDMDDTLFSEHAFVRSGFQAASKYLEAEYGVSGFFEKAWGRFVTGERGHIFNHVLAEMEWDSSTISIDQLVAELLGIYRGHAPDIELFEDARWALDHFAARVPLALISDGYLQTQKNKADALGITSYIKRFYFTDQWGSDCWKPACCAFEKVEEDFSVSDKQCVYISDNLKKDFIAPNQLGWRSIHVKREHGEYSKVVPPLNGMAEITVQSLYELEEVLQF